jgi:LysM repeat protein
MRKATLGIALFLLAQIVSAETVHVVGPGETLSKIAARYLGSPGLAARLAAHNNIADPNRIAIGQKIRIPEGAAAVAPTGSSSTAVPSRPGRPGPPLPSPAATPSPEAEGQRLVAIEVSGPLGIVRDGALIQAGAMSEIRPGDSLRTAPTGRVLLSGMNGERYLLGPDVSLLVEELSASYADRRCLLRLDKGWIHLQAPETPFLTRYLIATPSGSISARHGELIIEVLPPALTRVSVVSGRAVGTVPMGSIEIPAQTGLVLKTTDPPPLPRPLPSVPGLSITATKRSIIVAAAAAEDETVIVDLYRDEALQKHMARRTSRTDRMGLVLERIEVEPGEYWIMTQSMDRDGLVGAGRLAGPIAIIGD